MTNNLHRNEAGQSTPYDELEVEADRLLDRFRKHKTQLELLRQAAELYRRSANPEGKQISDLLEGMYLFERGKAGRDPRSATDDLCRAYRLHRRAGLKTDELVPIRLAWLKRRIDLGIARHDRRLLSRLFLRVAQILEKQGRIQDFHLAMYMHELYAILSALPSIDKAAFERFDRMMAHAREIGDPDMLRKAEVMMHRVRASLASGPAEAAKELEKSLEAIRQTSDRFGEEEAKGSLALSRALATANRKGREMLLAEAADKFMRAGERAKAFLAVQIASRFPIRVAAVLDDLKVSLSELDDLGKAVQALAHPTGPSAVFYHQSYLQERIKDVMLILQRLGTTRKEMTELAIKEARFRGRQRTRQGSMPKRFQAILTRQSQLQVQMKLDMESLYIFGNLALDQWALMIAYLASLQDPEKFGFHGLVMMLQAKNYAGALKPLWDRHRGGILWLYYQLRFYRNIFVEHLRRPWQRGTTMTVYGEDFNLFIPTPPGWEDEAAIQQALETIRPYAPKALREAPDDYWEKRKLRRLLEVTFMHIDEIPEQEGRDKVWEVWSRVGGSTPSYEVVGYRLARFLKESIPTMTEIVSANPERINLGRARHVKR